MSNIVSHPSSLPAKEFTREELDLIKSTVAKGATDSELKLFIYRCKNMELDPLKPGQVHFIKYGSSPASMVVGIDGFRAKAQRTGKLVGIKRGVLRDANAKCVGAWCEVYRSDWEHPAREEVSLSEYNTGKSQWAKMPETMIKKVAEAAALRMAFPDDLGGVYAEEEMGQAQERDARPKEIQTKLDESTAAPEFEAADYFEPIEHLPTAGTYVIKAGKNKGKRINELSTLQLDQFADWYDNERDAGKTFHPDVVEYRSMISAYVDELKAAERD